mmetsp:Transcript_15892/g.23035  ORF Transcript_15892/g.23035 Transcript_15892/m.23035 type:complete len:115 (+) Transcript_15892:64-408(+)
MKKKEYFNNLRKERSAQKIQAVYRGYLVRKHFLAVKLRFERILKSIEGDNLQVEWKSHYLCKPSIKDLKVQKRLQQIQQKEESLNEELLKVRKAIQKRKDYLAKQVNKIHNKLD